MFLLLFFLLLLVHRSRTEKVATTTSAAAEQVPYGFRAQGVDGFRWHTPCMPRALHSFNDPLECAAKEESKFPLVRSISLSLSHSAFVCEWGSLLPAFIFSFWVWDGWVECGVRFWGFELESYLDFVSIFLFRFLSSRLVFSWGHFSFLGQ